MEIRVIGRGALAGLIAGVLGLVFARIWAEPVIAKSIDYESGRTAVLAALNTAAGRPVAPEGPEIFSRTMQSTVGLTTGIIVFSVAMGALVAVAYLVLHGRFAVRPQTLAWLICGFGFLGVFLLPFVKYPANPPAIGHTFTIVTRGQLYLTMVAASLILLGLAVFVARQMSARFGLYKSVLIAAVGFLILYGVLLAVLPSLGELSANAAHADQFGFAPAATETPQPITNILSTPLVVDGKSIAPGQIVYPGFDADVLWKFRWYSLLNQVLVWTTIALVFGALIDRLVVGPAKPKPPAAVGETASVA
ncbi:MAG TPA: CbtA family protein [Mycobacterium sp.]|nr:CbtA family protein [Mycobacterium sp.]HKI38977.1 CbtA family protein [Mycobacterium sp.]